MVAQKLISMAKYIVNTTSPVLVTGATGYIAGWLVKQLIDSGVTVHAGVRDPTNMTKVKHLLDMAKTAPGDVKLFKSDLLIDGSYKDAMQGCEIVFHTASPFILKYEDPQKQLVDPAVNGTKNILHEACNTPTVNRVVLTSSCAAVYGGLEDVASAPGGVLTEDCWNERSSLTDLPYFYSKVLAERTAWEIAKSQNQWRLVVVNPALVFGPALSPTMTSGSFEYVANLGNGHFKDGLKADFSKGFVDVRDVAEAHMAAGYVENAEGRFLNVASSGTFSGIADILRESCGKGYPLPPSTEYQGIEWKADNSKSVNVLGIKYRSVDEGIREMFQQLIDVGRIKKIE